MTTTSGRTTRINRLETAWHESTQCPTCGDYPRRLTYEDPETGETWHETMPETGCPTCGLPIMFTRTLIMDCPHDPAEPAQREDARRWIR